MTPKTKESEWVNWEIEYAHKAGKRIIGIYAHGANECDVPEALEKYADDVRGWNSDGIVDAILAKRTSGTNLRVNSAARVRSTATAAVRELHSYVVARDYGFAPNPFFGFCTLATCKPRLRSVAQVGDW